MRLSVPNVSAVPSRTVAYQAGVRSEQGEVMLLADGVLNET